MSKLPIPENILQPGPQKHKEKSLKIAFTFQPEIDKLEETNINTAKITFLLASQFARDLTIISHYANDHENLPSKEPYQLA